MLTLVETKGTVLQVATTSADLVDTVRGELGHRGGAAQQESTLLAGLGALATSSTVLVF